MMYVKSFLCLLASKLLDLTCVFASSKEDAVEKNCLWGARHNHKMLLEMRRHNYKRHNHKRYNHKMLFKILIRRHNHKRHNHKRHKH